MHPSIHAFIHASILNTRTLEHWNTGTLEHWNTGTLEHWNTGTLEHWNRISPAAHASILNTGTLEQNLSCGWPMMRKCRNVQQARDRGGGFTHHGRRRIHYRIHYIIQSAREGGVQSRRRSSLSRSSRREAQDEKLKTRSSRRGSRHSCLPCDVELGNQQETDMTSHTPGNGQRLGISKADERRSV
jgi:hypothetical protein